jgi:acyl-CoA synthetase (AMP-forming)/AMP-acid ligase II
VPMVANIAETLSGVASLHGSRVGLIEAATGRSFTFAEVHQASMSYAAYLYGQGVEKETRVMLMVKPSMDFVALTFALFTIGATVILIDPGMGFSNLRRCIAHVKPQVLIGTPSALVFSWVYYRRFRSIGKRFCCGRGFGNDIRAQLDRGQPPCTFSKTDSQDLAAILFTTGSTGPPKGVCYTHAIFAAQLDLIRHYYGIGPDDIDQPGFPLFALFSLALGARVIVPDMNPSRPALVDPEKFTTSIEQHQVTYSFGSPAIWRVVSNYCRRKNKVLSSLRKVLMAGAPVPGDLIERVAAILPAGAQIDIPYGATESLPIVSITGEQVVGETWALTKQGKGACVGLPLPGISILVIEPVDGPIEDISEITVKGAGEIGEIIVSGSVITASYYQRDQETRGAKIADGHRLWHRMGDMGYLDDTNRLWFCGRKAHCVHTPAGTMYPILCEAIFNTHEAVFRSALVGVRGKNDITLPAIVVEKEKTNTIDDTLLITQLRALAKTSTLTRTIDTIFIHPSFPVDIRHNAKIFREQLSIWATKQSGGVL